MEERTIYTHGRPIPVRRAYGDIAVFTFDELCGHPMSAADYLCIASHFSIIIIKGVTMMTFNHRDEARRFITMIDIFYDNKVSINKECTVEEFDRSS